MLSLLLLTIFLGVTLSSGHGDMAYSLNECLETDPSCVRNAQVLERVTSGVIRALTYNVAGLPQIISPSDPVENIPIISSAINDFDIVFVQEDFWYHRDLISRNKHPFHSPHYDSYLSLGDGLSQFAGFPFQIKREVEWEECHGVVAYANDCWAPKGFTFSEMRLTPERTIHVYNLHMDAGRSWSDHLARREQLRQLGRFIERYSKGQALIVAGDFNLDMHRPDGADKKALLEFLETTGLNDACHSLQCTTERIDRILFRGSEEVSLSAKSWDIPGHFLTQDGVSLSDHDPVAVRFDYQIKSL